VYTSAVINRTIPLGRPKREQSAVPSSPELRSVVWTVAENANNTQFYVLRGTTSFPFRSLSAGARARTTTTTTGVLQPDGAIFRRRQHVRRHLLSIINLTIDE